MRNVAASRSAAIDCAPPPPGETVIALRLTSFEHHRDRVASRGVFARRMALAVGIWFGIIGAGLAVGIAGYMGLEGFSLVNAFYNAAMILSGMGPATELRTAGGKLFAGSYAILSGLIIIIAAGFVLAPIFHRVLHKFHVETRSDE